MNTTTQPAHGFPNNYEVIYTVRGVGCAYLLKIKAKIKSLGCGTFLDELYFKFCGKDKSNKVVFRIGDPKFAKPINVQQAVKYGAVAYVIAAILVIPAGICARQDRLVEPDLAILLPSHLSYEPDVGSDIPDSAPSEPDDDQQFADLQADDAEPDLPFHEHIIQAAQTYQVDAALIRAIIMVESNYNPNAVSHRGAQGLMQLMPRTAKWLGVEDSFDPALNIDAGVRYFKRLLDRFNGNVQLALAAYNAGSRYVRKYGGVPPFRATRIYIKKVMNYHRLLQDQRAVNENGLTTS